MPGIVDRFVTSLARTQSKKVIIAFLRPFQPSVFKYAIDKNINIGAYIPPDKLAEIQSSAAKYRNYLAVITGNDILSWVKADLPELYAVLDNERGRLWFWKQIQWIITDIFGLTK